MNVASFISKRIAFNKQKTFSRFIIRLATAATALSVAAMIITICFVTGFQKTISQKVFSFWGHLRVMEYMPSKSIVAEETPIATNDTVVKILQSNPEVEVIQPFATKSAVLDKKKEIEGVLIKGVDKSYNFKNLAPYLKAGRWPDFSDSSFSRDIVISQPIADELNIKLNDQVNLYFISSQDQKAVARKMKVVGLYKTGIEEYDKLFAIGDLRLIQKINGWNNREIGGYEVFLKDYHKMDTVSNLLYDELPDAWVSRTTKEIYPSIFDWLDIQDVNRNVIFIVMSIVAIINLITCLLILVLERTTMVGILQSLGAKDSLVRVIFLDYASLIALKGIIIGFVCGVGICLLEKYTGFIKLDENSYYVSSAPVAMMWWQIFGVCIDTFIVCYLSLLIPVIIVKNIKPVKAIAFN